MWQITVFGISPMNGETQRVYGILHLSVRKEIANAFFKWRDIWRAQGKLRKGKLQTKPQVKQGLNQNWWHSPVILSLRSPRKEDEPGLHSKILSQSKAKKDTRCDLSSLQDSVYWVSIWANLFSTQKDYPLSTRQGAERRQRSGGWARSEETL